MVGWKEGPAVDRQLRQWRRETPGCANRAHLNNAGAALMPLAVLEAVQRHLRREAGIGGYEAADEAGAEIEAAYSAVATLLTTAPANIALTENATAAFAQAMSAFALQRGDMIVTTRNDYISNQILFLSMATRYGIEVLRAADLPEGGVDPDSVRQLIRHPRCRLVALTWVPTNSGLVQPVEVIGKICREAGIPYVVDACQAVGQIPIDVGRVQCDFLSATARKFLRGPRGIGFLYVSDAALERGDYPLFVDMRGARWTDADRFHPVSDAKRFENWEFAYALVLGLGEAALYAAGVGIDVAGARARDLAAVTRERLVALPGIRILDRGSEVCAIVSAEVAGWEGADIVSRLREWGINVSAIQREFAVIDMDEKGTRSGIRISPHYYNTHAEIDRLADALAELGTR